MGELTTDDVSQYTNGLLSADSDETQRILDAALRTARNDVRWYVSPVIYGDVIKLNGPGTNRLRLPTKQVINLISVTNDGVELDLTNDVILDPESQNLLIKTSGVFSCQYGGVVVTMDHGFPEDAAAAAPIPGYTGPYASDWRQAILAMCGDISQIATVGRSDCELSSKQIDDVVYRWGLPGGLAAVEPTLSRYRLLWKWI
jgi:hypothetical protein